MTNSIVVMALNIESGEEFKDIPVLYTGVGKYNAVQKTLEQIHAMKPSMIINLGSAGSNQHAKGSLVCCTSFIQRDMDVTALGFSPYQTPFEECILLDNGIAVEDLPTAVCGSGDSFNTSHTTNDYTVSDMEAYALAKLCMQYNIKFLCIKYISDNADDEADSDWQPSLNFGAQQLRKAYDRYVK